MEPKNRLFVAVAVILLIVIALLTSFGRSLFILNTPSIVLPDTGTDASGGVVSGGATSSNQYQPVAVTPATVQDVIATLHRGDSYYREVTIESFWEGGASTLPVQIWTDGGWSHSRQSLASGAVRHDLVGKDMAYYWYDGSSQYESAPADSLSPDLAQRVPTYERVLALDPNLITAAGYETRGELPCVFVEFIRGEDLVERYWVSIDSGLLVSAEMESNGFITYRMTAYVPLQTPCPVTASFSLPDGTALHTLS